jgi:hypothetical protein
VPQFVDRFFLFIFYVKAAGSAEHHIQEYLVVMVNVTVTSVDSIMALSGGMISE